MTEGRTHIGKTLPPRLLEIRAEIDEIDHGIVWRLVKRARLVREAAAIKKEHGLDPRDEEREQKLRLLWAREAGRSLLTAGDSMAERHGFWQDLAYVFDSVLDFCSRQRG